MQHVFTEQELQQLRVASAERFNGKLLQIDLDDPICATIVVAPFDRESYAAHVDAKTRDPQTSYVGALRTRVLWPSLVEIEKLRQEWPVLGENVTSQLVVEAGSAPDQPFVRRLDVKLPPMFMNRDEAATVVEKNPGRLWAVDLFHAGFSCVMKAPLADTWLAARTLDGDARMKAKDVIAATEPHVLGAVVWSSQPLIGGGGLLDTRPALYWDLWTAYLKLGGDGAAVRRKSI